MGEKKDDDDEEEGFDFDAEMVEDVAATGNVGAGFQIPGWVSIGSALVGLLQLSYTIEAERERRADEYFQNPRPELHAFVSSFGFEIFTAFLITLNAVLIGWQASVNGDQFNALFNYAEHIFVAIFLVEWTLRILSFGWVWIFEFVNFCDTVMVFILGVIPKWCLEPAGYNVDIVKLVKVLRALRLVRLARAVRHQSGFQELWILVYGLSNSVIPLTWTVLIGLVTLYLWGLAAMELVGRRAIFLSDDHLMEYFGTLPRAMFTMLQIMTFDGWGDDVVRQVIEIDPNMVYFFYAYVGSAVFVFWNLITAVVVESAFKVINADAKGQELEAEKAKKEELANLANLFMEIDVDGSGELSSNEFFTALTNPRVKGMLDEMEIDKAEMEHIWQVLDDGDGVLTIKEFTTGMRRMRGQSKAKEMAEIVKQLKKAIGAITELEIQASKFEDSLMELEQDMFRVTDDVGRMLGLFHEIYHRFNTHIQDCNKKSLARERARSLAPPPSNVSKPKT